MCAVQHEDAAMHRRRQHKSVTTPKNVCLSKGSTSTSPTTAAILLVVIATAASLQTAQGLTVSPSSSTHSSLPSAHSKGCDNCVEEANQIPNRWTMPLLKSGEKRYYLGIFFRANWFRAQQYCRFHGMHLASISSQEENDKLEKHIKDFGLGHEHFWTSGTDLAEEGSFFWMASGRPITFTNWNAGEPNNFRYENGEEENCMELWNRDGKGLKWNDSPCSFETFFVCEVQ